MNAERNSNSNKGKFKQKLIKLLRNAAYILFVIIVVFVILNLLFPLKVDVEYSQIVTDKDGNILYSFLTADDKWRMMTELDEISPQLRKAIVFKEDKYFYYHPGINPLAIVRAVFNNVVKGKRTSGASTITMQVARMLNPKRRTYFNKITEMFRAVQLELKYSKAEILQLYLNLVPYGGNIEGVKAASVLYFEKNPNHLNLAEITTLSVIPNRPTSLQIGNNNDEVVKYRNKWLLEFDEKKVFAHQEIMDALEEPLIAFRHESPKEAPHFSYRMKMMYPNRPIIKTNLDLSKQKKTEALVSDHIKRWYANHVHNAAVFVIDNRTMNVVTYVGSADFFNKEDGGQVDGVRAVRSPGSALKPLVYALAIDAGIITPKSMLADVPVNFSGYAPQNYDEEYHGKVTVEFALAQSLNIPAVKILEETGTEIMVSTLAEANFKNITKNKNNLGLSLILGGCGVSLEEMVGMYSAFAHNGIYQNVRWVRDDSMVIKKALMTDDAAFMITEILTQLERPDFPNNWQSSSKLPTVAWKTGTSYGRRDAWSIGFNSDFTIGVWVGNFSGEGVPELTGANAATPLLFSIFNAINYNSPNDWFDAPDDIGFRLVCSETGFPPSDFCENTVMDFYIPAVSTNQKCNHLIQVYLSANDSFSYCLSCLPESGYKTDSFPNLPVDLIAYYDSRGINYKHIPPHNPDCERIFEQGKPKIVSPVSGVDYLINETDSQKIMLECDASADVKKVHWYVNNRLLETSEATQKVFFYPPGGKVKISCTDDKGRNSDVWLNVEYVRF